VLEHHTTGVFAEIRQSQLVLKLLNIDLHGLVPKFDCEAALTARFEERTQSCHIHFEIRPAGIRGSVEFLLNVAFRKQLRAFGCEMVALDKAVLRLDKMPGTILQEPWLSLKRRLHIDSITVPGADGCAANITFHLKD
jgi:hypothetical protein